MESICYNVLKFTCFLGREKVKNNPGLQTDSFWDMYSSRDPESKWSLIRIKVHNSFVVNMQIRSKISFVLLNFYVGMCDIIPI